MDRRGRDAEMGRRGEKMWCSSERQGRHRHRWSHIHVWWIEIRRDILGLKDPSPRPDHTAQRSST